MMDIACFGMALLELNGNVYLLKVRMKDNDSFDTALLELNGNFYLLKQSMKKLMVF